MANYTASDFLKAQVRMAEAFANNETRTNEPVTFKEFALQSELMFPSHKVNRKRGDSPASEMNYMTRSTRSLGTGGETYNHSGSRGDSAVLTPTWVNRNDEFMFSLKQADKNVFSLEEQLAHEFINMDNNFAEGLETLAVATLWAGRSGVNVAIVEGTFNAGTDVFAITNSTHESRSVQITKMVMEINRHKGPYVFFCDPVAFNKFEYQFNQGSSNSTNLSFQFGQIKFINSIELSALFTAASGTYTNKGNWLAVPVGTIGVLDWIPKQNLEGKQTSVNKYSTIVSPSTGLLMGLHEFEARSAGIDEQDVVTEVQQFVHLALEIAPDQTATDSPVMAFSGIT